MQAIDEKIILLFQSIRCELLTSFFKLFIPLEIWYGAALLLVLFFFFRTGLLRAPVISFVLSRGLATYCYDFAKNYFHRPRPFLTIHGALPVITPHGFSFPSGHATLAMASAVVLAYHFPKAFKWIYAFALLTGLSRVYLGVHYMSDVLAGFVLGAVVGGAAIFLERIILSLAQGVSWKKKAVVTLIVLGGLLFSLSPAQAKGGDEQTQIILLNDSASALEDSDPELSKSLTAFADEKEKEWEINAANKTDIPAPVIVGNIDQVKARIKLLDQAAKAIQPTYPMIAKSLIQMAKEMNKTIELKE